MRILLLNDLFFSKLLKQLIEISWLSQIGKVYPLVDQFYPH